MDIYQNYVDDEIARAAEKARKCSEKELGAVYEWLRKKQMRREIKQLAKAVKIPRTTLISLLRVGTPANMGYGSMATLIAAKATEERLEKELLDRIKAAK